jgi:sterol desaturase/sphingolipid hydroxylase (fatty acid hydroxylase superfamily)
VLEEFLRSVAAVLLFQLIGASVFTPLEIFFPRQQMTIPERARGLLFLFAGSPVLAFFVVFGPRLIAALGIHPIELRSGFGAPVLASIALALWIDVLFYTFHRIQHRFLWRFHAVHHSIENVTAINSYHHWTEPIWYGLTVGFPLLFISVDIAPTLGFLSAVFRYWSFYIHSPTRLGIGPLSAVLVDNRYHRIHHSTDPKHHDRNFGAFTPLWDWLFGTLYRPRANEWPEVGLRGRPEPKTLAEWSMMPFRGSGPVVRPCTSAETRYPPPTERC